jgi:hypothetical protein
MIIAIFVILKLPYLTQNIQILGLQFFLLIRSAPMPAYSPGQHAFHDDSYRVEGQELFYPTPAAPSIIEFTKAFLG